MSIEVDKLLVLKAFYLGRRLLSNSKSVTDALKMIDAAIESLTKRDGDDEKLRLLFYILLRCEITRGTDQSIQFRQEAKNISNDIKSRSYEYYMIIEEATQSTKQVVGFSAGFIADKGVKEGGVRDFEDEYGNAFQSYVDPASNALGVDFKYISPKESHFLHDVNLMDMLRHHKVDCPVKHQH